MPKNATRWSRAKMVQWSGLSKSTIRSIADALREQFGHALDAL